MQAGAGRGRCDCERVSKCEGRACAAGVHTLSTLKSATSLTLRRAQQVGLCGCKFLDWNWAVLCPDDRRVRPLAISVSDCLADQFSTRRAAPALLGSHFLVPA